MTVYLDVVEGKGFGVFASKDFKKGELIEKCPVLILSNKDSETIQSTLLDDYQFAWGDDEKEGAICFGYGSMYNHHPNSNAEFDMDYAHRWIVFKATRDIKKGEEVCIDYQWDAADPKTPDWFKQMHELHKKENPDSDKEDGCDNSC
jgi:SET domain-containing protein